MKLGGAESMITLFADIGAGQWLRYVVGVLEVSAAVGLLIPRLCGLAAAGLVALMAGALVTRAAVLGDVPAIEAVYLAAAAALVLQRRGELRDLLPAWP